MKVTYRKRTDTSTVNWIYDLHHENKRYRKSGFKTKNAAIKAATESYQSLQSDNQPTDYTLKDYYMKWLKINNKKNLSKGQYAWYIRSLDYFLKFVGNEDIKLKDITRSEYQHFLNTYGVGRTTNSVKKVNGCMKQVFRDAVYDGVIKRDPSYDVKLAGTKNSQKEDDKYISITDYLKVIEYSKSRVERSYIVIFLLAITGARYNEVNQMTYNDINHEKGLIHLVGTKTEGSDRIIAVNPKDITHVNLMLSRHPRKINNKPFDLSARAVLNAITHMCNVLDIKKDVTTKTLRHTHCSYLLSKQVPIEHISKRLGHATIKTTLDIYSHLLDEYKDEQDEVIRDIFA